MKMLIEIEDNKAEFVMELLGNFSFVKTESCNENDRTTIEQYNLEIEQADAEIAAGNYLTHEEAINEISSWREK